MPEWTKHGLPVLVLSPVDAPLICPGTANAQAGMNSYNESMDRYGEQFRELLNHDADYYLLFESDALCLRKDLPEYLYVPDVVWSNHVDPYNHIVHFGDPDPDTTYKTHHVASQSPWFFSRSALEKMVEHFDEAVGMLPSYAPYIDWWFHIVTHVAGLEHRDYGDDGISHAWEPDLRAAVRNGAFMIHAVKTKEMLAAIKEET